MIYYLAINRRQNKGTFDLLELYVFLYWLINQINMDF